MPYGKPLRLDCDAHAPSTLERFSHFPLSLVVLVALFALVPPSSLHSAAPTASDWSSPVRLASNASGPTVVGDAMGKLHVFYVEGFRAEQASPSSEAIMYMRGSEQNWSRPIDVLMSPSRTAVRIDTAVIDRYGLIHILWNDGQALYHSSAHVDGASIPSQWKTSILLRGPVPIADMAEDSSGTLHILARSDEFTISYLRSDDGGATWTSPSTVFAVDDRSHFAIASLHMASSPSGTLHSTWSLAASEVNWNFWSVWYGQSKNNGISWDRVKEVAAPRFGGSDIAVDGEGRVFLVWGRNIGFADGRWYQWSQDDGAKWTKAAPLFPAFNYASGDTGGYGFALDSAGTLHLVNSFGDMTGQASAYYLYWQDNHWSTPVLLLGQNAHFARTVITLGNRLHFFALAGSSYELYYEYRSTSAPAAKALPIPTARSATRVSPAAQTTVSLPSPSPSPFRTDLPQFTERQEIPAVGSNWAPILGALSPLLLIGLVAAWNRHSRR